MSPPSTGLAPPPHLRLPWRAVPVPVTATPPCLLSPLRLPTSLTPSRLKRLAINAATTGRHRSAYELPPSPYKSHREHPRIAPPLLTRSSASLLARVSLSPAHRPPPPFPSITRPPHCRPRPGEQPIEFPVSPLSLLRPADELRRALAPVCRPPARHRRALCPRHPRSTVDPSAPPVHRTVDSVHRISGCKLNREFLYFCHFAKRPLYFLNINPQSTNFHEGP
jgi:hypothetical protein